MPVSKAEQAKITAEANEWESAAEVIDFQNAILITASDALCIHDHPQVEKIRQLLEHVAGELHSLYLKCDNKQKAIREPMFEGGSDRV